MNRKLLLPALLFTLIGATNILQAVPVLERFDKQETLQGKLLNNGVLAPGDMK